MTDVTPQPEPPPALPVLMGRVLADVAPVGKNSTAPSNMGGYAFRGIEDVLAALKPAMAKHGVFCLPHIAERIPSERHLSGGKIMFVVDLFIVWTFYGPAGDSIQADAWGQGTDMGDKATQKAMTSAFKSMLMQTFVIGDSATDAEAHSVPETERQQADPEAWFKENGWSDRADHDAVRDFLRQAAAALDDRAKEALKEWRKGEGLEWSTAWSRTQADAFAHKINLLFRPPNPTDPTPTPETPAPAPLSVADAESVGNALVEHLRGMDREALWVQLAKRDIQVRADTHEDKLRQKLGAALLNEGWRPANPPSLLESRSFQLCAFCGTGRTDNNELVDYREDGMLHPRCRDEQIADRESAKMGEPF